MYGLRQFAGIEPLNLIDQVVTLLLHVQRATLAQSRRDVPRCAARVWALHHAQLLRVRKDDLRFTVQQLATLRHVADIGCCARHRMHQSRVSVCAYASLHAEISLGFRLRLMHLRIAVTRSVLRRTRRRDQGHIEDCVGLNHQSAALKSNVEFGKGHVSRVVLFRQVLELQDHALIWRSSHRTFMPREFAVWRCTLQRLFHRQITQTEVLRKKLRRRYHLQPERLVAGLALRVARFDHHHQFRPKHHSRHLFDELALLRLFAWQTQPQVCLHHKRVCIHLRVHTIASLRRNAGGYADFP